MDRAYARDSKRQMAKCGVAWRVSVTFVRNANDSTSSETGKVTNGKGGRCEGNGDCDG